MPGINWNRPQPQPTRVYGSLRYTITRAQPARQIYYRSLPQQQAVATGPAPMCVFQMRSDGGSNCAEVRDPDGSGELTNTTTQNEGESDVDG